MGMRRGSRRVMACSTAATGLAIGTASGVALIEGSTAGASDDTSTGGAATVTVRSPSLGSSADTERQAYEAPAAVSASALLIAYCGIAKECCR